MALVRCKECGKELNGTAAACLGCGASPRSASSAAHGAVNPNDDLWQQIHEAIYKGNQIEAVKLYRKLMGADCGLATAKMDMDRLTSLLRTEHPEKFTEKTSLSPRNVGGIGFALLALFAGIAAFNCCHDEGSKLANQQEVIAEQLIELSQTAVKQHLKAPSTAKFPGILMGRNDYSVSALPDGSYRVFSWVDSQNSFGSMIRSKWAVQFKESDHHWEVLGITIE